MEDNRQQWPDRALAEFGLLMTGRNGHGTQIQWVVKHGERRAAQAACP